MNRREFLKAACAGSISFMTGTKVWAFGNGHETGSTKKLVVIFLRGGADGLNMIIPYGDRAYYAARSAIAIPPPGTTDGAIDLDGHFGLHPSLEVMKKYWQDKSMAFLYAAGSPDPTRSHFEAQAYMESGALGSRSVGSGWMNRLVALLPGANSPLQALSVASKPPLIFSGPSPVAQVESLDNLVKPISPDIKPFADLYAADRQAEGKVFSYGIAARRQLQNRLDAFMAERQKLINKTHKEKDLSFGQQLSYLFSCEPGLQLAFVDSDLWDSHTQETDIGQYSLVLARGISDLIEGLGPAYADTTIVVLSEFGRTVRDNGNGGTEHGHGNVMWVLGGGIPGGKVYGRFSSLATSELHEERDLPVTTDFRQVVGYLLNERMAVAKNDLAKIFPDYSNYSSPFLIG